MELNETKSTETTNLAGGAAHEISDPREALRMVTINNLLEDTYYETDAESFEKLWNRFLACADEDPEFVLQLAAYARQEMYVRDVPQILLVMAAWDERTKPYVRTYAHQIVDRVDELNTVLAFNNIHANTDDLTKSFGDPGDFGEVPRVLKRALAEIIEDGKFDEYQFAKYRQENHAVSLHDVYNVTHPFGWEDSSFPTEEQAEIAERITKGNKDDHPDVEPLRQRRTWEDEISAAGQEGDVTPDDWRGVLDDMGIFARVRNLRNMIEAGLSGEEILEDVDADWVRNSQMYPFRFYQARKALLEAGVRDQYAHEWLEKAVNMSCESVPPIEDTLVAVDLSGSMSSSVANRSDLQRDEIAALFGAMLTLKGARTMGFGSRAGYVDPDPLSNSVLQYQESIAQSHFGNSTHGHKVFELALEQDELQDRVVFFTDMQIWSRSGIRSSANDFKRGWEKYRDVHAGDPHLYLVDLASYGEIKMPENYTNVRRVQGWNSKILDYIFENENAMVEDIAGM